MNVGKHHLRTRIKCLGVLAWNVETVKIGGVLVESVRRNEPLLHWRVIVELGRPGECANGGATSVYFHIPIDFIAT